LKAEAVSVRDLPWTEVDDFADLERARAMVQAGD
jgi:choline kinase